ncbi:MAG: nucleotidyltransferase family protein [Candidatus Adiutrix sp.]
MLTHIKPLTGAIILAAGKSQRAQGPKCTWLINGCPSVRQVALTVLNTPAINDIVLVVGAFERLVTQAVKGLPLKIITNPVFAKGQSHSIAAGLKALNPQGQNAIFLVADQPFITPDMLGDLINFHHQSKAFITAPLFHGQRYGPMIFNLTKFREPLMALRGDQGGRVLAAKFPEAVSLWPADHLDLKCFCDFDTQEEYEQLSGKKPPP